MSVAQKLDVELDVNEQPEQANFPRRPNVVSHRGHTLLINVTITEVPLDREFVTIAASVFTFGPERVGEAAHVSRTRTKWGQVPARVFDIDPETLPATYKIFVEEGGDEHLGQGPYEAVVIVNSSTERPPEGVPLTEGEEFSIEFTSM
jgi:hypothetical protein